MKIAVIGAGIMGQLTALALHKHGHELTIFEKQDKGSMQNCSMAAAGMLSGLTELEKADHAVYELGQDSLNNYWPKLIADLPAPVYFSRNGTILISHPHDQAELERFVSIITKKLANKSDIQALNAESLRQRETELNKFTNAYYFSEEAQLDNQSFMTILESYLSQLGVQWRYGVEVTALGPRYVSYQTKIENYDWVLDCRGLAAKEQFEDLRGIRGELIWLKAPEVKIKHLVRVLHPRYSLYLVPRPEQIYLLGASEIEGEDFSEISLRTSMELLSAAYFVHSGFAEARIIKTVTHCRPTLNDHNPKIKFTEGLIAINGLYRHGFLLAPALAKEVETYLQHGISAVSYPHFWEKINVKH